jgi:hypothetical protein
MFLSSDFGRYDDHALSTGDRSQKCLMLRRHTTNIPGLTMILFYRDFRIAEPIDSLNGPPLNYYCYPSTYSPPLPNYIRDRPTPYPQTQGQPLLTTTTYPAYTFWPLSYLVFLFHLEPPSCNHGSAHPSCQCCSSCRLGGCSDRRNWLGVGS